MHMAMGQPSKERESLGFTFGYDTARNSSIAGAAGCVLFEDLGKVPYLADTAGKSSIAISCAQWGESHPRKECARNVQG